jgi:uroporphyrinogen-III decarboxylase
MLEEKLTYIFSESTLVQTRFMITDYVKEFELLRHFVANRSWEVNSEKLNSLIKSVGDAGIVIAGEFFSPLKMFHFVMGPVNTVYFLMEYPERAKELVELHERAQLRCIEQTVRSGAKVIMAMDNLDTMFHTPEYIEDYSSSFYKKASALCHEYGALFFIHACGQQKDNLKLISSYGVDGLEGVAFPPLGDVMLDEAMLLTDNDFIITGGISAMETRDLKSRDEVFEYVERLFRKMLPFKKRFIFSSSCNTAIDTSWETIINFRDAWLTFRTVS